MADDSARRRWAREFAPHLGAAFRLARWLLGGVAEAEDVVQEASLRAWQAEVRRPAAARAWLLAITRNAALTRLRARRRSNGKVVPFPENGRELERLAAPDPSADAVLAAEQRRQLLRAALAELPAPFREVVVLRDVEGLSYREIAEVLGLPEGTVMSRLSRGRRALRALLEGRPEVRDAL